MRGIDASGAIVIVYYKDKGGPVFLMGQETMYLTETNKLGKFKSKEHEDVYAGFLKKGSMNNDVDIIQARRKFTGLCKELEVYTKTHVTYSGMKNSNSKAGYISAKPRCVSDKNKTKYGFPKGGFEQNEDMSVDDAAIRECRQETSVELDIKRLAETDHLIASGKDSYYKLYLYELSKLEYDAIHTLQILEKRNADYENELHNVCFKRIPNMDFKDFFINAISRVAYEKIANEIKNSAVGGGSKMKGLTRKVKSKYVKSVLISSRKNTGNWFSVVFKK